MVQSCIKFYKQNDEGDSIFKHVYCEFPVKRVDIRLSFRFCFVLDKLAPHNQSGGRKYYKRQSSRQTNSHFPVILDLLVLLRATFSALVIYIRECHSLWR